MSDLSSLIGRTISFRYPAHNFNVPGIPRTTECRCARIENVRDCREFPIEAETRALNPHLNRGNFLLETYDFDRHGTRHFYFESMQDVVIEHGEPGAEEEHPDTPQAVFVVDRPEGWAPAGPGDVPPNVERYQQPSPALAAEFAAAFNHAELTAPKGVWAVV
jgi:hypothetical protein